MQSSQRSSQSAGVSVSAQLRDSPFARPLLTTSSSPEKSTILYKDFLYGVKKRKELINKLRQAAMESTTPAALLKKTLLDVRLTTLTLIEDALEIEYRARLANTSKAAKKKLVKTPKLPSISSFRAMEGKEDVLALVEIINDVDDLLTISNIRVMLPMDFPNARNPFMLGKDIDELAVLVPPHPEPGNAEEELKVLELLRYKRAARALIRAEAQVLNRLPIDLYDVDVWLDRVSEDENMEYLLRSVCTLLDNDREDVGQEADLSCLQSPLFSVEGHELIRRLNMFKGAFPMRVDVQVAVRQRLRGCVWEHLTDSVSAFLLEWLELVLQQSIDKSDERERHRTHTSLSDKLPSVRPQSQQQTRSRERGENGKETRFSASLSALSLPPSESHRESREGREKQERQGDTEEDLVSVVEDEKNKNKSGKNGSGFVHTHEKIFEAEPPKRKFQPRDVSLSLSPSQRAVKTKTSEFVAVGVSPTPRKRETERETESDARPLHLTHKKRKIQGEISPMKASDDMPSLSPHNTHTALALKKKIRTEVERVMRDLGFLREDLEDGDNAANRGQGDALSAVRYELNKIQHELLKRNVLDGSHLTDDTLKSSTSLPMENREKRGEDQSGGAPVALAEKTLAMAVPPFGELSLIFSILLNRERKSLLCSVSLSKQAALTHGFVKENKAFASLAEEETVVELFHVEVSKLVFSCITQHTYEELLSTSSKELRTRMLQNVFDMLIGIVKEKLKESSFPRGVIVPNIDRTLFKTQFTQDNVLVELTISRAVNCEGILLHCVPLAGLFHAPSTGIGPVEIVLTDNELEVLLIAQRGLFLRAMHDWKALETLARWLGGRITARKVEAVTLSATSAKRTLSENDEKEQEDDDLRSTTSQLTISPRMQVLSRDGEDDDENNAILNDLDKKIGEIALSQTQPTTQQPAAPLSHTHNAHTPHTLLMLDVTLNRDVDVSPSLFEHWRARNAPRITGIELALRVYQELDVLCVRVCVTIPGRRAFRKMIQLQHAEKSGTGVFDMAQYSDEDENDEEKEEHAEERETRVELLYRLTRAECLAFGANEIVENAQKISMSKNVKSKSGKNSKSGAVEKHPEEMLWNVLSRLKVVFKGSRSNPYKPTASASDESNWLVEYDRLLHRDVKTVSTHVLLISVCAVGGALSLSPEHVDKTKRGVIRGKTLSESELTRLVHAEAWPMALCEYTERCVLAKALLDKLKTLPCENSESEDDFQLELHSFVESRMVSVTRVAHKGEAEEELGAVEVLSHHTLSDVRLLIKHEFDNDILPPQYRFIYKGTMCSLRQESFRRAWECLPMIFITPKDAIMSETGVETEDIAQRRANQLALSQSERETKDKDRNGLPRLLNGQRRVPGRYYAIPVSTLCVVQEGSNVVYTLHDASQLFVPGDVIRIGSVLARDYIIQSVGNVTEENGTNLQMITITPEYDIFTEPEIKTPIMRNFAFPSSAYCGMYFFEFREYIRLLKTASELGVNYSLSAEIESVLCGEREKERESEKLLRECVREKERESEKERERDEDALSVDSHSTLTERKKRGSESNDAVVRAKPAVPRLSHNSTTQQPSSQPTTAPVPPHNSITQQPTQQPTQPTTKKPTKKPSKSLSNSLSLSLHGRRVFVDCWMWKCVPGKDETRTKWQTMYDNGEVPYSYEYRNSDEFFTFFRVNALFAYIEVLCTDSRVNSLSLFAQRVNEMRHIPLETYTRLIFDKMTQWAPGYTRGIDRTKFIKLLRETNAFPDMKRPARVSQCETLFTRVVRQSEHGIVGKYATYTGWLLLLRQIAVWRFPEKKRERDRERDGEREDDEDSVVSVASLDSDGSHHTTLTHNKANKRPPRITRNHSTLSHNTHTTQNKRTRTSLSAPSHNTHTDDPTDDSLSLRHTDASHITHATQRLITEHLMLYPDWYSFIWREAKLMAMKREALRYCAATRIAALTRGRHWHTRYHTFLHTHTRLQAHIRRRLSNKRVFAMLAKLHEDWAWRVRYHHATRLQSHIRRFLKMCWYERVLDQKKKQEVILCKARRQKRKKFLEKTRKPHILRQVKCVNGVTLIVTVTRSDARSFTRDFGVCIDVYIPHTQEIFSFALTDIEMRSYMALALDVSVVTPGELLDSRNIATLLGVRLVVHKASGARDSPVVIFSKHALGVKGEHAFTRAKRIARELFVCKVFEAADELAVQLYHCTSCKVFNVSIKRGELCAWVKDDLLTATAAPMQGKQGKPQGKHPQNKRIQANPLQGKEAQGQQTHDKTLLSIENDSSSSAKNAALSLTNKTHKSSPVPTQSEREREREREQRVVSVPDEIHGVSLATEELPILQAKNKAALYFWALNHIVVDTRRGAFKVLWSNHYDKSRKRECLIKIQSAWRRALNRPRIIEKLDAFMLKVRASSDPEDGTCYYLNTRTGASTWQKPRLLGNYDLSTKPTRRWVSVQYEHQGRTYVHYVNPYTGKFSHLSMDQAVLKIQRLVRNHLLKTLYMPRDGFAKAVRIYTTAQSVYESQHEPPRKLSSVVNHALVLHAVLFEENKAKDVYREAVELSEANPLVTRAYAFYLLGTCEPPIAINRDRAMTLLNDAKRKDPEHAKFAIAFRVFQFAVLRSPRDHRALLNLALMQTLLYEQNYLAEKLFRRALAYAPFEPRTMEIWKFVKDRFPERHVVYNPLSRVHKAKMNVLSNNKNNTQQTPLRTVHGRNAMESAQWAGWVYVPKDAYNVAKTIPKGLPYWYNPADGAESLDPPDFAAQWRVRMARSHMEEDAHGLQQFFDPLTSEYFTYHPLTDTFA